MVVSSLLFRYCVDEDKGNSRYSVDLGNSLYRNKYRDGEELALKEYAMLVTSGINCCSHTRAATTPVRYQSSMRLDIISDRSRDVSLY